jgi:polyhydroxyalkanoate synthesis regulator phasin
MSSSIYHVPDCIAREIEEISSQLQEWIDSADAATSRISELEDEVEDLQYQVEDLTAEIKELT